MTILSASMGGGHMQVSHELQRRFGEAGWEASVADLLEFTPRWGRFLHWLYPWMVDDAPWLYELVYRWFFAAPQKHAERVGIPVRLALPGLLGRLEEERPDLVVSTYHLAGVAAGVLRASGRLAAPAVTFVTTFGVHDGWLHPGTDLYLCITAEAARAVSSRAPTPVELCEPVVRPEFRPSPPPPARQLRVALLVGGSLGLGSLAEAARMLAAGRCWRPVVVCGSNERLHQELSSIPGIEVLGWVDDMAGLMATADVVVDNAAGSTAKEALAAARPVVTFAPIAGHGRHDALMMQNAGLTEVVDSPADLPSALERAVSSDRSERGRRCFGVDPVGLLTGRTESGWARAVLPGPR